jgi:hypothetical protein
MVEVIDSLSRTAAMAVQLAYVSLQSRSLAGWGCYRWVTILSNDNAPFADELEDLGEFQSRIVRGSLPMREKSKQVIMPTSFVALRSH